MIILVMGVAGAGKTTISRELSRVLGWPVTDADSLHSPENIAKMRAGIPLTDAERRPWLEEVACRIRACLNEERNCIVACSALKESYRRVLVISLEVHLVYLAITAELARERLRHRPEHFMPASLVESQFADLEPPADAITVDASAEPSDAVQQILAGLGLATA
ncbi:MAG TPA: gluconokinase [Terriglobales bacterium]